MEDSNGVQSQLMVPKDRRHEALGDLKVLPDELICAILEFLSPRDVSRLACTSSVMYIFCNEEPLWMNLCLNHLRGHLQYKGSWKRTFLVMDHILKGDEEHSGRSLQFDGFNSLFLYKRMYRRYTRLNEFSVDDGRIERKKDLSPQEFHEEYDCKRPVLLLGLADTWPARTTWSVGQILQNYGDTAFKISQRSSRKLKIKLKDYVSYMEVQHDEDPLYIFDDKFGEVAPGLLEDYNVPHLFREDFFDVLDRDQHPPFRWLIIGPERSGASWHVDPALTSAWNTLLCGRKRWALYPPGRVPSGVTVHVNDEDGDVNIDTPSSLQWWLDIYPLLPDEDKPIECTQLPGETIFVPSGWWHCVLNLETTVAVTQNFVNSKNFEFVCLDMAPGHCHKGVCRAGLLAVEDGHLELVDDSMCRNIGHPSSRAPTKGKGMKTHNFLDDMNHDNTEFIDARCCDLWRNELPYEINFLANFLDEDRDHYNAIWSLGSAIGQRELREWLWRLWVRKPNMRSLIWKGACLALNAEKLLGRIHKICEFHSLPFPNDDEKLPVGTGSNPVYLVSDSVIKIFVEGGLESSLYGLGTELEFYSLLSKMRSPLEKHIPYILASGIISLDNGSYTIVPWVGKYLPDAIANCSLIEDNNVDTTIPFGAWTKRLFDYRKAISMHESTGAKSSKMWSYIITRRCKGKILAELRETLSWEDAYNLASFLGEKLCNIHGIPLPYPDDSAFSNIEQKMDHSSYSKKAVVNNSTFDRQWEIFVKILATRKKDVTDRLTKWGDPIPFSLIEKVHTYLPDDFDQLLHAFKGKNCSWIHSDIMDDNIVMEPAVLNSPDSGHADNGSISCSERSGETRSWQPAYILDFSNLSIGDPLVDLIPIYLDVFRGEPRLLKQFLASYKLPFLPKISENKTAEDTKLRQLSYIVMCYCILHEDNVLGAVFSIWDDLRAAESWEEVEQKVWGDLNDYVGFT